MSNILKTIGGLLVIGLVIVAAFLYANNRKQADQRTAEQTRREQQAQLAQATPAPGQVKAASVTPAPSSTPAPTARPTATPAPGGQASGQTASGLPDTGPAKTLSVAFGIAALTAAVVGYARSRKFPVAVRQRLRADR